MATRLRVCFEFRNGDSNFLRVEHDPERWVPVEDEITMEMLDDAYRIAEIVSWMFFGMI